MATNWVQIMLLALIALAILVILLLVIYLVDRLNVLERETQEAMRTLQKPTAPAGPFGGLSGKKLWDALASGKPPEGMEADQLDSIRERFRAVLVKHIASIFEEGKADVNRGLSSPPKSTRMIQTLRGQVESWMPGPSVNMLYQCGQEAAVSSPEQLGGIRSTIDSVAMELHMTVGLDMNGSVGQQLIPPSETPALANDGSSATLEAGQAPPPTAAQPSAPKTAA
jgi:hypothetical protein